MELARSEVVVCSAWSPGRWTRGPVHEVRTLASFIQLSSIRQRRQKSRLSSITLCAISPCVPSMMTTGRRSSGRRRTSSLSSTFAALLSTAQTITS